MIFAPVEGEFDFQFVLSIVTLVLSCHVSEISELLYAESRFFDTLPISVKISGVLLGVDPWCWGLHRAGISMEEFQHM